MKPQHEALSKKINFYKHHLGDYAAATAHLSWDEDCAYRRLMDQYYKREGPIPCDFNEACRLVRAITNKQKKAVKTVLTEFFKLADGDGWRQKRCDVEVAAYQAQGATNRLVAEQREAKRRERIEHESFNESLTKRQPNQEPEPEPEPEPETTKDKRLSPSASLQAHPIANALGPNEEAAEPVLRANGSAPDCPYSAIAEAYHQELPELPSIVVLSPNRKRALQARWREVCTAEHLDSQGGLTFFRDYFRRIRQSDFLLGKAPPKKPGERTFRADFDWIFNPANFIKIVEGRYHGRRH